MPYSMETGDLPMMVVHHHQSDVWLRRLKDQFDRLWQEGAERPRIMAMAIHPYISGQPHRIKYLEEIYAYINGHPGVVHWNGAEIYDWYNGLMKVHP